LPAHDRSACDPDRRESAHGRTTVQPQPHSFVAQTEKYRAKTIPWIWARATGALAGLLAHGSPF